MPRIFPSLISGDLLNLSRCIADLEPVVDGFHLDVMDFHFVPNLTWGPDFINAIQKQTQKQPWVDLLVEEPERYLERLVLAKNSIVSVHYESTYPASIWQEIRKKGWKASIGLDPKTPVSVVEPLLEQVDHVLLMSVKPGFSGQQFIPESLERLKSLHQLRQKSGKQFEIGIDGGMDCTTLPEILKIGVDTIAAGSAVFGGKSPKDAVRELKNLLV